VNAATHLIRTAVAADAAALAALAEKTFREAFGEMNSPADTDEHCRRHYSPSIQAVEIAAAGRVTLVSSFSQRLTAFTQLRWSAPPTCVVGPAAAEIQRFYVDREFHGSGLANRLMHEALATLSRHGSATAWLGVWEKNPRGIAFYRKLGFSEVGEQTFVVGADVQRDLVMARPV